MSENPLEHISVHFASLTDPRSNHGKRHKLEDILVIAIAAVICGADNWVDVETFGLSKEAWLRTFLELPFGIPSQYTFRRVFAQLEAKELRTSFREWVKAMYQMTQGQVIAIDGKTLRRSHDRNLGKGAIQMVSAWAEEDHLVLGQVKTESHSNEIEAIPRLLEMLQIKGCTVTIDAIGCQKEHTRLITQAGGDFVLAVKGNQPYLHQDLQELFDEIHHPDISFIQHDCYETVEKGHGRIEKRRCWVLQDQACLDYLRNKEEWQGINSLIMVEGERTINHERSGQKRYYISSLTGGAKQALHAVRAHWSIENSLHWVLDIAFREDESRLCKDYGAENMAVLRHLAINLIKQEHTRKGSIKTKRLRAGWDNDFLLKIISSQ